MKEKSHSRWPCRAVTLCDKLGLQVRAKMVVYGVVTREFPTKKNFRMEPSLGNWCDLLG